MFLKTFCIVFLYASIQLSAASVFNKLVLYCIVLYFITFHYNTAAKKHAANWSSWLQCQPLATNTIPS